MASSASVCSIQNSDAPGPVVLVCEHASNAFPDPWGDLGLTDAQKLAHIAWDPGALNLAQALAERLSAPLIFGNVSRLVYDLNRPPHSPQAMPSRSEVHDIPGNADLNAADRLDRTEQIYLPFHSALSALLARRLAAGQRPVLITIHSFTPVYFGKHREVEFGVIHDRDDRLARAIAAIPNGMTTRVNEPYSAANDVGHTLARHATPMGLSHAMLEIRNDLIAADQTSMADRLAPVLHAAMERV